MQVRVGVGVGVDRCLGVGAGVGMYVRVWGGVGEGRGIVVGRRSIVRGCHPVATGALPAQIR